MKFAILACTVVGLIACGSEPNKAEEDQSSGALVSSISDGSSSGGASAVIPSSSGGTSVATLSSIGGTSIVTPSSNAGTSLATSSSAGGTSVAISSNFGGTSTVTPSSNGGISLATSSSNGGTSVITPSSNSTTGFVTWQGKTYRTTYIGGQANQTWMSENLDYGTQVSASSGQVDNNVVEKSCYDDNATNCTKYGGLYTWAEAMKLPSTCNTTSCVGSINSPHQGICPDGWHMPTKAEFATLLQEVGVASVAGKYLKSNGGWPGGSNGTDEYGFTGLPSGLYSSTFMKNINWIGIWETDENVSNFSQAYEFSMGLSDASSISAYFKNTQISIRCIKN